MRPHTVNTCRKLNVLMYLASTGEGQCWAMWPGYETKCWATAGVHRRQPKRKQFKHIRHLVTVATDHQQQAAHGPYRNYTRQFEVASGKARAWTARPHNVLHFLVVPINAHLARSGVMKQASPLRARLASYWLWVEMSLRIMFVVSITTSSPSWKDWVAAK